MNKAEKTFRLYAIIVIFVLLTVLLAVINGINFTMAAKDADEITLKLEQRQGSFEHGEFLPEAIPGKPDESEFSMGPMGPDSPEMRESLRYFTISFSKKSDKAETVAFNISAVTEEEAHQWALSLKKEGTGWSRGTYRYRVYEKDGKTYVTVIDQGRELLSSYRILAISAIGELLCLVIAWCMLLVIGRKIYSPIEEAERKQKNFIKNANKEFRLPLTIISGNTELAERKYGPDDSTRSTRRQLNKLNELVDKLGTIGIFENGSMIPSLVPFSEFLNAALDRESDKFASAGIDLTRHIESDITLTADPEAVKKIIDELICNSIKFSKTKTVFELKNENSYVLLETKNDTDLPDGPAEQIFDRFTILDNAKGKENCSGLGLAYVKEIVAAHNGRVKASVADGVFTLRITI